jgi:alcohol dehydrogenase class IV
MADAFAPFTFVHSNRRVVFGWDALDQLAELAKELGARRPAAVLDEYFARTPVGARVAALLKAGTGAEPLLHATPAVEPDTASVEACAAALARAAPDFIVTLGGGSAMDTAKVARMLLSNPGPAEAIAGLGRRLTRHASVLVAVPTTHGTGSEVSESAVIGKAGAEAKLIYRSQEMTPHIALLDPALTAGAPRTVTAYAGYDAVTHAVEAYVSRMASPMTDPYAVSAMGLLGRWLALAYEEPENRDARGACLIASMQAAIAFNSANLGLAHAISGPLGAQQHVAHGLGNALALPYVTAFNEPVLGAKGETIARLFGGRTAAEAMAKLRRRLDLDLSLDGYVRTDADRERLAQWAIKSGQVKMNPRAATIEDMRAILAAMRTPTGDAPPVVKGRTS